ncbi:MAG: nickel-dependent lactate racemase [Desulfosudis oleivorans]|nr:nickel-dependent lactate racemase [Desulfosudis oleivorans]
MVRTSSTGTGSRTWRSRRQAERCTRPDRLRRAARGLLARRISGAAFGSPRGTPLLRDIARGARRVAVIVADSTRGVPTAKVMPMILEELACAGRPERRITVVIATGVHRPATDDEVSDIVGRRTSTGLTVISHDPYDAGKLVYLGKTSHGTPVEVSRTVFDADLRISVGKVEPHEFAGFSGGRKSVLPGIASERTIEVNHRPEMLMSPEARPGQLLKNPIHLDMIEAAGMLKIHFTVNLVLNQAGETIGIFAGDLIEAHLAAVGFMRSFCQISLKARPDIIVTTPGRPLEHQLLPVRQTPDRPGPGHGAGRGPRPLLFLPGRARHTGHADPLRGGT